MRSASHATKGKTPGTRLCGLLVLAVALLAVALLAAGPAAGADPDPAGASAAVAPPALEAVERERPYQTPLAGEAGTTRFLGYPVQLPSMDRAHMNSLTLGGSLLFPKQGDLVGKEQATPHGVRVLSLINI
jgi:flagellar basal body-associated protein FliL